MILRTQQSLFLIFLITFITNCSQLELVRSPSSLDGEENCITLGSKFVSSSSPYPKLMKFEEQSIEALYPKTLEKLFEINDIIKVEHEIIGSNGDLSTRDFFMKLLDIKNEIAHRLVNLSQRYGNDSIFRETLVQASSKIKASPAKRKKLLKKISEYAHRPYRSEELYDLNDQYYNGEVAALYGEIGELVVTALLGNVEKRGAYTYQVVGEISSLNIPKTIQTAIKRGKNQKDKLREYFASIIPSEKFDQDLLDSFINKEIDLIRSGGKEWIEVKNYKNALTWEDFQHGQYRKTAQQAEKTHRALEMLGIRDKVKLKQIFLNCVDSMTAIKFQELYGIEIIGCIQ